MSLVHHVVGCSLEKSEGFNYEKRDTRVLRSAVRGPRRKVVPRDYIFSEALASRSPSDRFGKRTTSVETVQTTIAFITRGDGKGPPIVFSTHRWNGGLSRGKVPLVVARCFRTKKNGRAVSSRDEKYIIKFTNIRSAPIEPNVCLRGRQRQRPSRE